MRALDAEQSFRMLLKARGIDLDESTAEVGLKAVLDFYRDTRADDCRLEEDGDMLLYQWGPGSSEEDDECFELGITRQLVVVDEDDSSTWQLSLIYRFDADDEPNGAGSGKQWCMHPAELEELESEIHGSEAYDELKDREPNEVVLSFGQV